MNLMMRTTIGVAVATALAVYVFTPMIARASNDAGSLTAVVVGTSEQGDAQAEQSETQAEQAGDQGNTQVEQSGDQGNKQLDQNVEQTDQSGEQQS
jgi:hypothetical protein